MGTKPLGKDATDEEIRTNISNSMTKAIVSAVVRAKDTVKKIIPVSKQIAREQKTKRIFEQPIDDTPQSELENKLKENT